MGRRLRIVELVARPLQLARHRLREAVGAPLSLADNRTLIRQMASKMANQIPSQMLKVAHQVVVNLGRLDRAELQHRLTGRKPRRQTPRVRRAMPCPRRKR